VTKTDDFSSQPGQKGKIKSLQHVIFERGLFVFGRECEQKEQEGSYDFLNVHPCIICFKLNQLGAH